MNHAGSPDYFRWEALFVVLAAKGAHQALLELAGFDAPDDARVVAQRLIGRLQVLRDNAGSDAAIAEAREQLSEVISGPATLELAVLLEPDVTGETAQAEIWLWSLSRKETMAELGRDLSGSAVEEVTRILSKARRIHDQVDHVVAMELSSLGDWRTLIAQAADRQALLALRQLILGLPVESRRAVIRIVRNGASALGIPRSLIRLHGHDGRSIRSIL